MEELKRKAAQNSGEAEYIEKVVYTVKQSAEDVKKVSKALLLRSRVAREQLLSSRPSPEWTAHGYSSEISWVTFLKQQSLETKMEKNGSGYENIHT